MKTKKEYRYISQWVKKIKAINLLGGKCKNCGESRIWILNFHHKNPNKKEFDINKLRNSRWSLIEKEVKKCILLCRNCHAEIHKKNNNKYPSQKKNLLEIKNIFKCEKCNYEQYEGALDFHHEDSNEKKFELHGIKIYENSCLETKKKIIDEVNKCTILCSNCHADLHFDKKKFEIHKNELYNWKYKETPKKIDKELVIKMYKEGKRQIDISKELKCSKATICVIIKSIKLPNKQ